MEARKLALRETRTVLIGVAAATALMFGVYALLGRFGRPVLLGGLAGAALAVGNFYLMALNAGRATEKALQQDVRGGQALMRSSYMLRMVALFALLVAAVKLGGCDPIAAVVPVALPRWILTAAELFRRDNKTGKSIKGD